MRNFTVALFWNSDDVIKMWHPYLECSNLFPANATAAPFRPWVLIWFCALCDKPLRLKVSDDVLWPASWQLCSLREGEDITSSHKTFTVMVCDHLRLISESEDVLIFPAVLSAQWLGYARTAGESEFFFFFQARTDIAVFATAPTLAL